MSASLHRRSRARLGMGCASLGMPAPALEDAAAEAVIAAAWERGIRFFDVAPLYGGGVAEERLGRALLGKPRLASQLMQLGGKVSGIRQALRMSKLSGVIQSGLHPLHSGVRKAKRPQCFACGTLTEHFAVASADECLGLRVRRIKL